MAKNKKFLRNAIFPAKGPDGVTSCMRGSVMGVMGMRRSYISMAMQLIYGHMEE